MTTPPELRPSRLSPLLMTLAGTALFAAIAADVTHHGKLAQADQALAPYLHEHTNYYLVLAASACSGLGEFWLLFPLALAVGAWLIRRRQWRPLATWAAGLIATPFLCGTLKNFFAIPRPARYTLYTFDPGGYTFPSGHTMGAMITSGLLALLWMRLKPQPRRRRLAAAALVGLIGALVAASLVYVGVHYLSDVLAAQALSLAWLGVLRFTLPPAADAGRAAYHDGIQTPGGKPDEVNGAADTRAL